MESWTHSYCYECFSSVIHHPFCKISNNVLFSCCSPFGIQPCFQAHPQIGVVSVHSSNSLYFLLPFGNNGICFLQNPILPTELGFIHNPLTQKIFFLRPYEAYQVSLQSDASKCRFSLYPDKPMGRIQ